MQDLDDQEKEYMPEEPGLLLVRVATNAALMAFPVMAGRLFFEPMSLSILLTGLALALAAAAYAIMQRNLSGILSYTLWHAAVVVFLWLTSANRLDFIFRMIVMAIATVRAYEGRIAKEYHVYPSLVLLALPGAMFVPAYTVGNRAVQALCVLMVTYIMLSWLLYRNLRTIAVTIREARAYTKVPFIRMRRANAGMVTIFILAAAALAGLIALAVDGEAVIRMIRDLLANAMHLVLFALAWLLYKLFSGDGEADPAMTGSQGSQGMPLAGAGPENEIFQMISAIIGVVLFVAVTLAIIYLAYRFFIDFYHDFRAADMENKDKRRYILPDERERRPLVREEGLSPFDFSPDARIRRAYVRLLRRHPEAKMILPHQTPAEIEAAVLGRRSDEESEDPLSHVHACYELARYAPERVTEEDVRIMREAVREIK